jgi:hypothetical protein
MAVTEEPRGLNWINNINTNAFGSLNSQACWFVGSVAFTLLACYLMTRPDEWMPVGATDENGVRQMVMMTRETTRNLGNLLAQSLLLAWTGKTVAGVVDSQQKRKANPAYAEVLKAETEAKVTSTATALALKEAAKDADALRKAGIAHLTGERPALDPIPPKKDPAALDGMELTSADDERERHDAQV